jgi:nitrite reductase/ring-hydroxylating ferredoxin subunit
LETSKNNRWIKIADSIEEIPFDANSIAEVVADGKKICMAKHKEDLFAFTHKCPHAGGFFIGGYIDPLGNVVCPLHRYKYCLANGRNVSGEGYYLKHWPVEVREDGVYVGFEKNRLFGLF